MINKSKLIGFILLVIIFVYFWKHTESIPWNDLSFRKKTVKKPQPVALVPSELGNDEKATIKVFEQTAPSVVTITNSTLVRDIFSLNVLEIPKGIGSGFVWDNNGHIVTNFHVLHGGNSFEVIQYGNISYTANVVGVAPEYDLAVLKVSNLKKSVHPLPIGTSSNLRVGQKILTIGNPFGLDRTLTTGVISAISRSIKSLTGHVMTDIIQTDAAINPGSSGGPLLDSFGRVIGISIAIYSPNGTYSGVGFAVPIDTISRIVPQIIAQEKEGRPGLGITLLPDTVRKHLGIDGAIIYEVSENSAAQKASLSGTYQNINGDIIFGDIVISAAGNNIFRNEDLLSTIAKHKVGDKIDIEYIRNNKKNTASVTLQKIN